MKVRCIAVGMGSITRQMLGVMAETTAYEPAAFVDVSPDALADAQARFPGVPAFTDLTAALEQTDADAALVNTPSELHYAQARTALEHGYHTLVAKPVTNDFAEACELIELAESRNVKLVVGQQMRYMKHYRAVAGFVAAGRLGAVETINLFNPKPRPEPANLTTMDQPALLEISCHHFDVLMSLVPDAVPETIACTGFQPSWSRYAGPCMVNAWLRFSGGLNVLYQGGLSSRAHNYELRLEGSEGALRCRGLHMSIDEMTNEFAPAGGSFEPSDVDAGLAESDPWHIYFDLWHDYLAGGQEPPFSGRNNLKVFALLSAGIESVVAGGAPTEVAANPKYAAAFEAPLQKAGR